MLKFNNDFINYYLRETEKLVWFKKPKIVFKKNENNHYAWFPDGRLNLYENCISNNLKKRQNKTAIITVNQNKEIRKYSFVQIDKKVNKISNYIKKISTNKKLRIMIHASASLESAVLMFTCAKLGLHFSVIFEELESLGIQNRIKLFKPNIFFSRLSEKIFISKMGFKSYNKIKFIYGEQLNKIMDTKENAKK